MHTKYTLPFRAFALAALAAPMLAVGACRTTDEAPDDGVYDAVAGIVGDVAMDTEFGELALAGSAVAVTSGEVPLGLTAGADGTFFATRAGAMIELRVECQDAASRPTDCEAADVDGAEASASVAGEVSTRRFRGSVSQTLSFAIRGASSGTLVLEGSNDVLVDADATGSFFSGAWSFEYSAVYDDIEISPATGLPVSGRIQYRIDASRRASGAVRDTEQSYRFDATLTFGRDGAELVIDGDHEYSLDLAGEEIVRI